MPSSVLIIGASRGLGAEFVKQYQASGFRVIATARKAADVKALTAMGVEAHRLDVTKADHFIALKEAIGRRALDVAVYNAGVYGPNSRVIEPVTAKDFDAVMHANVLGAIHAIAAIGPAVARAKGKLALVSSKMGAKSSMTLHNAVTYRASKAAANAVVKAAANQFAEKGVTTIAFHPGWVRTDMGGSGADISPEESIAGMRAVLSGLSAKDNGKFFNYNGELLAW
jgi:NAD(P)-dependent dehydrogenase (short-subunit alcohol dehydrogenase family)